MLTVRTILAMSVAGLMLAGQPAVLGDAYAHDTAASRPGGVGAKAESDHKAEVDTGPIFGFTEGSDIGDRGDKEGEVDSIGAFGKRAGRYNVVTTSLELAYTALDNFQIAPNLRLTNFNVTGVPGLEDRQEFTLQGTGVKLKYRVLDRTKAPFGLTFAIEPNVSRVGASGELASQFGLDMNVAVDREVISDKLFAAFNLIYEPEWSRARNSKSWERSSNGGLAFALSTQVRPGLLLGGEVRYFRAYDGLAFGAFQGDALFIGPSVFLKASDRMNFSVAWSAQVAGHAVGDSRPLDLVNFERHQVRVRGALEF